MTFLVRLFSLAFTSLSSLSRFWVFRLVLLIGVPAAIYGYGYHKGAEAIEARLLKERLAWEQKLRKEQEARNRITRDIEEKYAQTKQRTRVVYRTLYKTVEKVSDGGCLLPPGWVRVWNKAAMPTFSHATAGIDEAAGETSVTEKDVLRTWLLSAERFHDNADRLRKLQEWIRRQSKVSETND